MGTSDKKIGSVTGLEVIIGAFSDYTGLPRSDLRVLAERNMTDQVRARLSQPMSEEEAAAFLKEFLHDPAPFMESIGRQMSLYLPNQPPFLDAGMSENS